MNEIDKIELVKELISKLSPEVIVKLVLSHPQIMDCQILTDKDVEEMYERQKEGLRKEKVYSSHDVDEYLEKEMNNVKTS